MSENSSRLRDALLDDGRFVLRKVVYELYQGSNQRPDVFFKSNPKLRQKNYNEIFKHGQRQTILSSGSCNGYDIKSASELYDVSLLALLAEHTCGLSQSDPLLKKVFEVRNTRNEAIHDNGSHIYTDEILCELLDNLLDLYTDILDKLEERPNIDSSYEKMEIKRKINERKPKKFPCIYNFSMASPKSYVELEEEVDTSLCVRAPKYYDSDDVYSYVRPSCSASLQNTRTTTHSDSEIPTWGKVAAGVTAGIATFGLVTALDDKQSEQKKHKDSEIPTWGKVAAGVTAGIAAFGLVSALDNKQSEQRKHKEKEEECAIM